MNKIIKTNKKIIKKKSKINKKINKKLNILYVTGETIPHEGGSSTHIYEFSESLIKQGHKVTILANIKKGQKKTENYNGINIIRTKLSIKANTLPILNIKHILKFITNKKLKKFDAIIERFAVFGGFGAIISRFYKIPYYIESNGPHIDEAVMMGQLNKKVSKILHKWAEFQFKTATKILLVTNNQTTQYAKKFAGEKYYKKVEFIYNGVNTSKFSLKNKLDKKTKQIKNNFKLNNKTVFLFVGSFKPWMGVRDLIKAAKEIKKEKLYYKKYKDIIFLIVGSGKEFDNVKELTKKEKVEDICILTGSVKHSEVPYYYASADVGIAPFNANYHKAMHKYGFYWCPVKLLEYMAIGIPIITTKYNELKKIIEPKKSGQLFKEGDIIDLKNTILKLFNKNKKDLEKIGKYNSQKIKKQFTWDKVTKNICDLIIKNGTKKKKI